MASGLQNESGKIINAPYMNPESTGSVDSAENSKTRLTPKAVFEKYEGYLKGMPGVKAVHLMPLNMQPLDSPRSYAVIMVAAKSQEDAKILESLLNGRVEGIEVRIMADKYTMKG